MKSVPVRVSFEHIVTMKGQRASSIQETTLHLPISEELLEGEGSVQWRFGIKLCGDAYQRLEGVPGTIRRDQDELPVKLVMDREDIRTVLAGETVGAAAVELPMRAELDEGRELVNDGDGRPQGAIDRTFIHLSWDRRETA